jgi:tight adherence protein C
MLTLASLAVFAAVTLMVVGSFPFFTQLLATWRRAQASVAGSRSRHDSWLRQCHPVFVMFAYYHPTLRHQKTNAWLDHVLSQSGGAVPFTATEFLVLCELTYVGVVAGLWWVGGTWLPFPLILISGAAGLLFPVVWLQSRVKQRHTTILRELPYFLDALVMIMEAGAGFLDALELAVRMQPAGPVAEEWRLVLQELSMGQTRREALRHLASRTAVEEVQQLVITIINGEEMGTPLGTILRTVADGTRLKRSQQAEIVAAELAVKIHTPVVMMLLAVGALILGPALVTVMRSGRF